MTGSNCAKCNSGKIIPAVRIVDLGEGMNKRDLTVEVYENPGALFMKGTHRGSLSARICGDCGYAELYVDNPDELYTAYLGSRRGLT